MLAAGAEIVNKNQGKLMNYPAIRDYFGPGFSYPFSSWLAYNFLRFYRRPLRRVFAMRILQGANRWKKFGLPYWQRSSSCPH